MTDIMVIDLHVVDREKFGRTFWIFIDTQSLAINSARLVLCIGWNLDVIYREDLKYAQSNCQNQLQIS